MDEEWTLRSGAQPVASDADLAELHALSFLGQGRAWSPDEFHGFRADNSLSWVEIVPTLSRHDHVKPLAMALFRVISQESELLTLCRNPNWRGRGLGPALMARVVADAYQQGAKTMFLEVSERNQNARNLYDLLGFEKAGLRKRYYRNDDGSFADALVLRTQLRPNQ